MHNTNTLLGRDGFVGVKTGSTAAAGGCFAFRAIRWIDGKRTTITGVVLGQPGYDQVAAGLAAADAMVNRIAGHGAVPDSPQTSPTPGTPPRRHAGSPAPQEQTLGREPVPTQSALPTRGETMSRALRPPAALAMVAESARAAAARRSSGGNSTATTREKAVKFAECMRANGVSAFPDPDASGELTIDGVANGSSLDTSSAAFERALSACKDLEPPGFTGTRGDAPAAGRRASSSPSAFATTACRTSPTPPRMGPSSTRIESHPRQRPGGMSILNAAMRKCGKYASAAGVQGSR